MGGRIVFRIAEKSVDRRTVSSLKLNSHKKRKQSKKIESCSV